MDMSWKLTVKMGFIVDCFKSCIENQMSCRIFFKLQFPEIRIFTRNLKTQKYTEYFENRQTSHLII